MEIPMADTPTITPPVMAEPFNDMAAPDRLEFRKTLDLFFVALQADWNYFAASSDTDTAGRFDLGHAAAAAWASCTVSLKVTRDMRYAHADLRAAATGMLETVPEQMPSSRTLDRNAVAILTLAKAHKKARSGLADLLEEAFCLLEAYKGNLAVMSLR